MLFDEAPTTAAASRAPNRAEWLCESTLFNAAVIFLSSFLLFQVEPMIARIIVSWFGGTAAVWTVCLVFFQTLLLLGYAYAHFLATRIPQIAQRTIHIGLLVASLLVLPISPSREWRVLTFEDPTLRILGLLLVTVGLPYFCLTATGPLIQIWLSNTPRQVAPYRLFSVSNVGSLLGLISYPLVFEHFLPIYAQAQLWSGSYLIFCVLCMPHLCKRTTNVGIRPLYGGRSFKESISTRLVWASLAACSSAMLYAITNHLSQNVAPIPMLWVLPLSLYLVTFAVCFRKTSTPHTFWSHELLAVALVAMAYGLTSGFSNAGLKILIPLYLAGLFICCMSCHGELARRKPLPERLTSFYLMIALGGSLGGIFVSILAPLVFRAPLELPVILGACSVLAIVAFPRRQTLDANRRKGWSPPRGIALLSVVLFNVLLLMVVRDNFSRARVLARNFYGCLQIIDENTDPRDSLRGIADDNATRTLQNGSIDHGIQFLAPGRRRLQTTYYGVNSGVGLALQTLGLNRSLHVGVVGLGVGTLSAYGRPGDSYTFYEINPLVSELANREFTFLADSKANIKILLGDARMLLERQSPQEFDLLAIDAFLGDAIPVHLLTKEAFSLYLSHLKLKGILAVHISNRYLDLRPVVLSITDSMNLRSVVVSSNGDRQGQIYASEWLLITRDVDVFDKSLITKAVTSKTAASSLVCTDDFCDMLKILDLY